MVRWLPIAPKIQSRLPSRLNLHPLVAEIPDVLAPGLQLDKAQVRACANVYLHNPGMQRLACCFGRRGSFMDIGQRRRLHRPRPACARNSARSIPGPHKILCSGCSTCTPRGIYTRHPVLARPRPAQQIFLLLGGQPCPGSSQEFQGARARRSPVGKDHTLLAKCWIKTSLYAVRRQA